MLLYMCVALFPTTCRSYIRDNMYVPLGTYLTDRRFRTGRTDEMTYWARKM